MSQIFLVPKEDWPDIPETWIKRGFTSLWKSSEFTVKIFERPDHTRLEINRNRIDENTGRWVDGITWDEVQQLKDSCGFANMDAYEKFPRKEDVINEQNIRHIIIPRDNLPYEWANQKPKKIDILRNKIWG